MGRRVVINVTSRVHYSVASTNSKASAHWRTTTETRHRTRGKDRTEPPLAPALPLRGAGRKTRGRDRCRARRRGSRSFGRRPRFPRPLPFRRRRPAGTPMPPPTRCARGGRGAGARGPIAVRVIAPWIMRRPWAARYRRRCYETLTHGYGVRFKDEEHAFKFSSLFACARRLWKFGFRTPMPIETPTPTPMRRLRLVDRWRGSDDELIRLFNGEGRPAGAPRPRQMSLEEVKRHRLSLPGGDRLGVSRRRPAARVAGDS